MSHREQAMLAELGLLPVWRPRDQMEAETAEEVVAAALVPDEAPTAAEPTAPQPTEAPRQSPAARAGLAAALAAARGGRNTPAPLAVAPQADEASPAQETASPALESAPEAAPTMQALASPVETADWPTLASMVKDCTACGLCQGRTQTVFGVGDQQADWLFIGEAPGAEEDRQGEPFVGAAGKLLDNMLAAISLKRGDNVYIANVLKCRPPHNRDPQPEEVAACSAYLRRQVALIQPKVIVTLGRFAANTLLERDGPIGALRGGVHRYEGVPMIATYHPAYLLRNLPDKGKAWQDLRLAVRTFQSQAEPRQHA